MLVSYLDELRIQQSADMISRFDRQLIVTGWNPACERKFGVPASKALNRSLISIFPDYNLMADYRTQCLIAAAREGKSFYFPNLPYQYSEGSYYQVIVPLRRHDQEIIGALNVVRDSSLVNGSISKKDLLQPILSVSPSFITHLLG